MRALYFTLCIIAVSALPPRQYKKIAERKLELTTEAKIEEPPKEQPIEETKDEPAKEIPDRDKLPRAYYENQSVNVMSSTSATISDTQEKQFVPQVNYAVPQINIGRPQINVNPVQSGKPQQYAGNQNQQALSQKQKMEEMKKNVYTVNVYVNFPNDQEYEYNDDDECYKGKCWGKAKCKEGQVSVKGVCTDRQ